MIITQKTKKNSNDSIKEIATAIKINNSEINSKVDNANGTYRIDNEEIKENSIETNQDEKLQNQNYHIKIFRKMIAIIHLMKINQFIKEQSDLLITMLIITKTK